MPSPLCRSLQDFMVIAVAEGAGQKFVATGKTDSQRPWSLSVVSYHMVIWLSFFGSWEACANL